MNGTVLDTMLFLNQGIEKKIISIRAQKIAYTFSEKLISSYSMEKMPHEGPFLDGKN
jgi:hypothetical protein